MAEGIASGFIILFFVVFLVGMFSLMAFSLVWVYRDAKLRSARSPGLITFLCFLCNWPVSLALYAVMRKEIPTAKEVV